MLGYAVFCVPEGCILYNVIDRELRETTAVSFSVKRVLFGLVLLMVAKKTFLTGKHERQLR